MNEIVSNKLYEQVFNRIKEKIRSGELKQGSLLPGEHKLAEEMGVSRVTIRQALKQLAEVGLIETHRGKGSVVAVDWKSILDTDDIRTRTTAHQNQFDFSTQARRIIEPAIARQAAQTASEEDIEQIRRALLQESEEVVLMPVSGRTSQLVDFHTAIWLSLHNPILMQTWESLAESSAYMKDLPLVSPIHREEQRREAQAQHRLIFEAIARHDPEYAYFHMLRHCDWIQETYGQYYTYFLK